MEEKMINFIGCRSEADVFNRTTEFMDRFKSNCPTLGPSPSPMRFEPIKSLGSSYLDRFKWCKDESDIYHENMKSTYRGCRDESDVYHRNEELKSIFYKNMEESSRKFLEPIITSLPRLPKYEMPVIEPILGLYNQKKDDDYLSCLFPKFEMPVIEPILGLYNQKKDEDNSLFSYKPSKLEMPKFKSFKYEPIIKPLPEFKFLEVKNYEIAIDFFPRKRTQTYNYFTHQWETD